MGHFRKLVTLAGLCSVILGGAGQAAQDSSAPKLGAILEKWSSRQDGLRDFDFTLRGTCFEGVDEADLMAVKNAGTKVEDIQPVSYQKFLRFAVSGPKAYLEYNTMNWSSEKNLFLPGKTVIANNGEFEKTAFAPDIRSYPTFHIAKAKKENNAAKSFFIVPMNLVFRPLSRFQKTKLTVAGRQEHEGKSLVILNHGNDVIWLDPDREFVPVRYYQRRGDSTVRFVEIAYQLDRSNGWIPKSWKENGERRAYSATLDVEKYTINAGVSDAIFDIKADANALVSDYVNDTYYIDRGSSKRMLRPGEFDGSNTKYEEILRNDRKWVWEYIALGACGLAIAVTVWLWIKKRKMKRD